MTRGTHLESRQRATRAEKACSCTTLLASFRACRTCGQRRASVAADLRLAVLGELRECEGCLAPHVGLRILQPLADNLQQATSQSEQRFLAPRDALPRCYERCNSTGKESLTAAMATVTKLQALAAAHVCMHPCSTYMQVDGTTLNSQPEAEKQPSCAVARQEGNGKDVHAPAGCLAFLVGILTSLSPPRRMLPAFMPCQP